ncbi:MAG: preprotein translocase subunit SecG [Candidatus Omnitrophota bacterium]
MYIFLIVIHIIACIVLVLTILLQSGRGGGLSEAFGGGSTSTIFGTSASNFLQKATSACAIIFLVTSLSLAVLSSHRSKSLMQLDRIKRVLPQAQRQVMPQDIDMAVPVQEPMPIGEALPIEEAVEPVPGPISTGEALPIEEADIPVTE